MGTKSSTQLTQRGTAKRSGGPESRAAICSWSVSRGLPTTTTIRAAPAAARWRCWLWQLLWSIRGLLRFIKVCKSFEWLYSRPGDTFSLFLCWFVFFAACSTALRWHSQGTIQPNNLTIKHRIQQNSLDQITILVRAPKSWRKRNSFSQFVLYMVRQIFQHGSFEQTWSLGRWKERELAPEESALKWDRNL